MDVKDEILLRLQYSIKAQKSYIEYLQRILKTHHIDYDDINSITPKQKHVQCSELTTNELYNNASAKEQITSQYSEYLNKSQASLSSEHAVTEQSQSSECGSKKLLRNTANSLNPSGHNMTVASSTVNASSSQNEYLAEQNSQQCQQQGKNSDSCNANVKSASSTVTDSDSAIIHQRVYLPRITSDILDRFFSYFHGREDVYANRASKANPKTGKYGYYPKCQNFYKQGICLKTLKGNYDKRQLAKLSCSNCKYRQFVPLSPKAVYEHLMGMKTNCSDVIGIFPILPDETCYFLVFDFDDHESSVNTLSDNSTKMKESVSVSNQNSSNTIVEDVTSLKKIMELFSISYLVERSRSGNGFHIWVFFEEPVEVHIARQFGNSLLTIGADFVNLKSFKTYDRMLPASDHLPDGGLGNLIALPLQGMALRQGNSAFVDEHFIPYKDQFEALFNTKKLSKISILQHLNSLNISNSNQFGLFYDLKSDSESAGYTDNKNIPSNVSVSKRVKQLDLFNVTEAEDVFKGTSVLKKDILFRKEDIIDNLTVVIAHKIFIKETSLNPRFLNQLRRLSSFLNPQFYINERMGYSNYDTPRIISCFTEEKGYLGLPRGLLDELETRFKHSGISYSTDDRTNPGSRIKVEFTGQLYSEQQLAVDNLLKYKNGILQAATAFGKTVVGSYIISKLKVNALIIVHNEEIANNWFNDFNRFLCVDEPLPEYRTASGRIRHRKAVYGFLSSKKNTLTSIIDVVMVQSLGSLGNIKSLVKNYGLVIVDECHHSAAASFYDALSQVNARYFYGFSATPFRNDGLDRKLFYLFGPVRFRYTAIDKISSLGIPHYVISHFIPFTYYAKADNLNQITEELLKDKRRNEIIVSDIKDAVMNHRTPIVITKRLEHARLLFDRLRGAADNIILLTGALSSQEKRNAIKRLHSIPNDESLILIATGQYVGEGFNYPRLDTLFMTAPISSKNNVEQYAGRLNRDYKGKEDVIIFDYVDNQVPVLSNMYKKRISSYHRIGFNLVSGLLNYKNTDSRIKTFFDIHDYSYQLNLDLKKSQKEIVIYSNCRDLSSYKRFTHNLSDLSLLGVNVVIVTSGSIYRVSNTDPYIDKSHEDNLEKFCYSSGITLIRKNYKVDAFIVIDKEIVWYGADFIEGVKRADVILRLESLNAASELLEK